MAVAGLSHTSGSVQALSGIDLEVPAGGFVALLGPNGAGKTTLVHILCTLLRPKAGQARVAGYDVRKVPRAVRRSLGLVLAPAANVPVAYDTFLTALIFRQAQDEASY